MTPDSKALAAIRRHGPLTMGELREAAGVGKNNLALACRRMTKSGAVVLVQIGLCHYYGLPEHATDLQSRKKAHDDAVEKRIRASREASRAKEIRRAKAKPRRRYEWPSKLEFVPPPAIPISVFDYARQAGAAS